MSSAQETFNILLGVTGSVAAIKAEQIIEALREIDLKNGREVAVKVVATERAKYFLTKFEVKNESPSQPLVGERKQVLLIKDAKKGNSLGTQEKVDKEKDKSSAENNSIDNVNNYEVVEEGKNSDHDSDISDEELGTKEKTEEGAFDDAMEASKYIFQIEEFAEILDDKKGTRK